MLIMRSEMKKSKRKGNVRSERKMNLVRSRGS